MSIDPNFPVPESTFLFVPHVDVLAARTRPLWGWMRTPGGGTTPPPSRRSSSGICAPPTRVRVDRAAARGIQLDAVALAPRALDVTDEEAATLHAETQAGLSTWLVGHYAVQQIRPNAAHLRILLTRTKGDEFPPRDTESVDATGGTPSTIGGGWV